MGACGTVPSGQGGRAEWVIEGQTELYKRPEQEVPHWMGRWMALDIMFPVPWLLSFF